MLGENCVENGGVQVELLAKNNLENINISLKFDGSKIFSRRFSHQKM